MTTYAVAPVGARPAPELVMPGPAEPRPGWARAMRSVDHKQIGIFFIVTAIAVFLIAGTAGLLDWIVRLVPAGDFLSPETFNRLWTLHDTAILFHAAIPLMIGLMTYVTPLLIGARSTALPRLSALAYWLVLGSAIVLFGSLFFNAPDAGSTGLAPLTATFYSPGTGIDLWAISLVLAGAGFAVSAIDLLVTIHGRRTTGMSWSRLPVFAWTTLTYAWTMVVIAPVISAAALMLLIERQFEQVTFFASASGGSPLLWQHLYWFFAHPAYMLMLVCGIGIAAEIIQVFARAARLDRRAVAASVAAFAGISVLAWGQHLFSAPIDNATAFVYMILALAAIVPGGLALFNLVTAVRGRVVGGVPFLFALGFLVFAAFSLIDSVLLAVPFTAGQLVGSQFAASYFDELVIGSMIFGGLGGLFYWFPKITGRLYSERIGRVSFALCLIGLLVLVGSTASLGFDGMPAFAYRYGDGLQTRNIEGAIGAVILAGGVFTALIGMLAANARGALAGNDPWHGRTLEWFAPSPPPLNNFDVPPEVTGEDPMTDLRRAAASGADGVLAGSVAQPPSGGRPSLKGAHSH